MDKNFYKERDPVEVQQPSPNVSPTVYGNRKDDCIECVRSPRDTTFLRGLLYKLVNALFTDKDNMGVYKDQLGCIEYGGSNTSDETRGFQISLVYDLNVDVTSKTPGVIIATGQRSFDGEHPLGLNSGLSFDNSRMSMAFSNTGPVNFVCLHYKPDLTFALADCVTTFLVGCYQMLADQGVYITPLGISELKQTNNSTGGEQLFRVDVTFNVSYETHIVSANESLKIKEIAQTLAGIPVGD